MKAIRYAAAILLALVGAGGLAAQTTNVTATLSDPTSTLWINAPYTINLISPVIPSTNPGNNSFTTSFSGTTDGFGVLSATLQRVANIFPANTTWQFCVVSGVSFTQKFCVNIPVGNAGQSSQDVSSQINAILTAPVINGGAAVRAYNDAEVQAYLGAMYFNVNSLTFRCYNGGWGVCGGTGTGIGTITWALPSILSATPTTLNGSGTQTFSLTTQSANTVFAGPATGSAAAPTFRSLVLADLPSLSANTVLGQTAVGTPIALSLPNCNTTGSSALIYTASTGFGCNTIAGGGVVTSLTTTGTTGAAALTSGVLNIPVYQGVLTLTTSGSSGAATLSGNTLNIPQYAGGGVTSINSTAGAFTFTGAGVSCTTTTCTFSGSGSGIGSITWALPPFLTASPSTISATGTQTFSLATQSANTIFAGPASGSAAAPTFRALVSLDIPNNAANTTGTSGGLSGSPSIGITNLAGTGTVTLTGIEASSGSACLHINASGVVTNTGSDCGAGSGLPTAPAAAYFPSSTAAGTTYAAVNNIDWTHTIGLENFNGDFYVDAVLSPTSCTVSSVAYTTAFDCALANAKAWIASSDSAQYNATLHVGSNGKLTTNVGIQEPTATSNHGTVNIVGNGVNASIIQLTTSLSSGVCMFTQPPEATAFNYAKITVSNLTLDANNDADCTMGINGVSQGAIEHLLLINNRAGSGNIPFQIGPSTASTSTVFEANVTDVVVGGLGGGYTPAIITCTVSSGNPVCTISDAGSYPSGTFTVQVHGVGNGSGPCSVYPTWTTTGTTTLTGLTASGGTCVAPLWVSVTPGARVDYDYLFGPGYTDSTVKDIRAIEETVYAGIKVTGHPNTFLHPHCYVGQFACVEENGGSTFVGVESDSIGGYAAAIEGTGSTYTGTSQIYNSFTRFAGSSLFYVDQGTSAGTSIGATMSGVSCNGNRQALGGYHQLVIGTGLPYANTSAAGGAADAGYAVPAGVQMNDVLDCSSSPTVNTVYSHIGTFGVINGGISTAGDGVHPGMLSLYPNTTVPTLTAGDFSILGPNTASMTAFAWQAPTSQASAGLLHIGAPSSAVSQMSVSLVGIADLSATGTPSSTTFLRGDYTWATPSGSALTIQTNSVNNTSQTAINFITSVTNNTGLVANALNPATSSVKFEITGNLLLASLATQAANTVIGNATGSTATPTALAMPSCSGASNALIWTSATGFGCNTLSAGGNVTASGTPTSGQVGVWTSATVLSGVTATGTGSPVLATSPTLVTPALGIPSALVLTNATGLPLSGGVTGQLPVANGGTGTASPALSAGSGIAITGSWPAQTIALAIANTTFTNSTTAIGANACSASASTVTMTGMATTSVIFITPSTDVSGSTGWGSSGGLTIVAWPTANTLNYKLCNSTGVSITPGAVLWNAGGR